MTSTLQQRVRRVARHARRLVRLYGISWFVAIVALATLLVGGVDYLTRFEDAGVRFICFVLLCLAMIWGFARFVLTAWRYRCSELQAARHIERLHPDLHHRLTSAVAFAAESMNDPQLGSAELRRAVVAETEAVSEGMDFRECLDRRQPVQALLVAVLLVATILGLTLVDASSVSLAAKRLLVPWGDNPWPRRHVLQWAESPTRLAVGQDFEVKLTDANGKLPDRVEIHYWYDGDEASRIQTFPMQLLGNKLVHRLANITRPFQYRATGGDDQTMAWTPLTLVEPPRITKREVTLHPPAYAGLEARAVEGRFRALEGTYATLRGRTSKPLSAALLETDTMGGPATIPLILEEDRLGFLLDGVRQQWPVLRSGTYGFRLIDQDGLNVGVQEQWDVSVLRDLPPTVSLKRPAADLLVAPAAQVALEAIVKDDLAVRSVVLHFLHSSSVGSQQPQTLLLWSGPAQAADGSVSGTMEGEDGVQRTVQYQWDLTQLPAAKPSEWIDFYVTAGDYHDQIGESVARRLTFISLEDLEERIGQRQSELLAEIAEIARVQRDASRQTADLEIQLRETGELAQTDADQLQAMELNQRQVQQRLGNPSDGVAVQVAGLMDEARRNRVDRPDLLSRLQQFHDTIQQLNNDPLVRVERQLMDALRIVRESRLDASRVQRRFEGATREELSELFAHVDAGQQQVAAALEGLLGELEQWDSYQRLAREVGRLKREQEDVLDRTQQLRVETLTTDPSDLTAQQRAGLKRLTQQQNGVALRFDTLASSMDVAQQRLVEEDPGVAATLADALEMIRRDGIGGLMRDAGREMDRLRLGQAIQQQDDVIERLARLQDVLANRRQQPMDRRIEQLRDAVTRLDQLRERQQAVRRQTEEAVSPEPAQFDRWAQEEGELAEHVEGLARHLQRAGEDAGAAALREATQVLRGASQAAEARELGRTRQASRDAQDALDNALRDMTTTLDALQNAVQDERGARLRQTVRAFLSRQQRLMIETRQAALQRPTDHSQPPAPWVQTVRTLSVDQSELAQEVDELRLTLADVASFAFAMQRAARCMASASQRLASQFTGSETEQLQGQAAESLQQILEAMVEEPTAEPPDDQQSKPSRPPDTGDQRRAARYLLAQLKLIRAMQLQVNQATTRLEQAEGPWDAARVRQQEELVEQQRRLTELLLQLLPAQTDPAPPIIMQPPSDGLDSLDRALQRDEGKVQ